MYPILAKILWDRIYDAILATPLAVRDLLASEVAWLALRLLMVASIVRCVMALFKCSRTSESYSCSSRSASKSTRDHGPPLGSLNPAGLTAMMLAGQGIVTLVDARLCHYPWRDQHAVGGFGK